MAMDENMLIVMVPVKALRLKPSSSVMGTMKRPIRLWNRITVLYHHFTK